jgi:hypothetical protein
VLAKSFAFLLYLPILHLQKSTVTYPLLIIILVPG